MNDYIVLYEQEVEGKTPETNIPYTMTAQYCWDESGYSWKWVNMRYGKIPFIEPKDYLDD